MSEDAGNTHTRGWFAEGILIVISVALGFYVSQCGESRADARLKARALSSLQAELEHNLAIVAPYVEFHRAYAEALSKADATANQESGFQVYFRTRPELPPNAGTDVPLPRRAAWDAATTSGAMRLIDYDVIAGLAEIYQWQGHLSEAANRLPISMPAFFDPATGNATVRQAEAAVREMQYAELTLVPLYKKQLDALRASPNR